MGMSHKGLIVATSLAFLRLEFGVQDLEKIERKGLGSCDARLRYHSQAVVLFDSYIIPAISIYLH